MALKTGVIIYMGEKNGNICVLFLCHSRCADGQPGSFPPVCDLCDLLIAYGAYGVVYWSQKAVPEQHDSAGCEHCSYDRIPQHYISHHHGCCYRIHLLHPADSAVHTHMPVPLKRTGNDSKQSIMHLYIFHINVYILTSCTSQLPGVFLHRQEQNSSQGWWFNINQIRDAVHE